MQARRAPSTRPARLTRRYAWHHPSGRPLVRAGVALACLVLIAIACRKQGNAYPPEVAENFMRACAVRASETACRCSLEEVQRRYTLEQYRALEAGIGATKQVPAELLDIITACR